jgi:hypothetical protein
MGWHNECSGAAAAEAPSITRPGAHDDIANAVAGALLRTGTRQPMRVSPRALEMSRQTGLRHFH